MRGAHQTELFSDGSVEAGQQPDQGEKESGAASVIQAGGDTAGAGQPRQVRECQGEGGYDLDRTNGGEGPWINIQSFIYKFFSSQVKWKLLYYSAFLLQKINRHHPASYCLFFQSYLETVKVSNRNNKI